VKRKTLKLKPELRPWMHGGQGPLSIKTVAWAHYWARRDRTRRYVERQFNTVAKDDGHGGCYPVDPR
jgi:hypothetical protein